MKAHIAIVALIGLGVLTASARPSPELLNAAFKAPAKVADVLKASANDHEAAQAVAQLIWMIQNSDLSDADKTQRTALVIAESFRILGEDRIAEFVGVVAERLNLRMLPVVTAAAVLAAGSRSPEVLGALVKVAGPADPAIAAVRKAAANPVAVLGAETATLLPIAPLAVRAAPVATASAAQQGQSAPRAMEQPVASTSLGGPSLLGGPRPPGMPPRPPAMPYRGQ